MRILHWHSGGSAECPSSKFIGDEVFKYDIVFDGDAALGVPLWDSTYAAQERTTTGPGYSVEVDRSRDEDPRDVMPVLRRMSKR